MKIRPSILNAPLEEIASYLREFENVGIDTIHLDVMDGHFVPKISFGDSLIPMIKRLSNLKVETHLMVTNPCSQIEHYLGSDTITFHIEAEVMPHRLIEFIKSKGLRAGLAINPGNVNLLSDTLLKIVNQVCMMTVNPGFGGQSLIDLALDDARFLKERIRRLGSDVEVLLDGGINDKTIQRASFADAFVVGSFLYKQDLAESVALLRAKYANL